MVEVSGAEKAFLGFKVADFFPRERERGMADAKDRPRSDGEFFLGNVDGKAVVVADKFSKDDALHFEGLSFGSTAVFVYRREGFPATKEGDKIYGEAP